MFKKKTQILPIIIFTSLLLVSCSSPPALPSGPDAVWRLVVIGDSTLFGLSQAYSAQIEKDVGVKVEVEDFSIGGLSAHEVLEVLQTQRSTNMVLEQLPEALSGAEVVVMFVNPTESIDPEHPLDIYKCVDLLAPSSCAPDTFEKYIDDLRAIWVQIFKLRDRQPVILRAMDIYNPVVVPWTNLNIFDACTECWENQSEATRLAADAYNIPFLSRYDLLNGPDHTIDIRPLGYTVSDGIHPSELMNKTIAEELSKMGYEPVTPP